MTSIKEAVQSFEVELDTLYMQLAENIDMICAELTENTIDDETYFPDYLTDYFKHEENTDNFIMKLFAHFGLLHNEAIKHIINYALEYSITDYFYSIYIPSVYDDYWYCFSYPEYEVFSLDDIEAIEAIETYLDGSIDKYDKTSYQYPTGSPVRYFRLNYSDIMQYLRSNY